MQVYEKNLKADLHVVPLITFFFFKSKSKLESWRRELRSNIPFQRPNNIRNLERGNKILDLSDFILACLCFGIKIAGIVVFVFSCFSLYVLKVDKGNCRLYLILVIVISYGKYWT